MDNPWAVHIKRSRRIKRNKKKSGESALARFKTLDSFVDAIQGYFKSCEPVKDEAGEIIVAGRHITVSGLCLYLTFSHQAFQNQAARGEEWAEACEWARMVVEDYAEQRLFAGAYTPGVALLLKHRFAWKDETTTKIANDGDKPFQIEDVGAAKELLASRINSLAARAGEKRNTSESESGTGSPPEL